MKDIYVVLRQKEQEAQQLQKDIEALRVAARLLADDNDAQFVAQMVTRLQNLAGASATDTEATAARPVYQPSVPTPRVTAPGSGAAPEIKRFP
jgi:hypothetical protein